MGIKTGQGSTNRYPFNDARCEPVQSKRTQEETLRFIRSRLADTAPHGDRERLIQLDREALEMLREIVEDVWRDVWSVTE